MHLRKYSRNEHNQEEISENALNIIIPIGGIGSWFSKEGYRYPKPLINIVGRPMLLRLIDNLSLKKGDTLWETLYIITQSMSKEHLQRRTISLDCDTIYWADILTKVRALLLGSGAVFYFPDEGHKPIFSYIKTDETQNGLIVDIQEKKAISKNANTGAYVFATGELLQDWAARSIDANVRTLKVGEYYTSQLIHMMVFEGKLPFLGLPVQLKDFSCVGTPEQLQDLLVQLRMEGKENHVQKRRFCFDLDMTLVGVPTVAGDYSTCPPIWKNIKLVQQLHRAGHYIIIENENSPGQCWSNPQRRRRPDLSTIGEVQIPYDDLHFGKPWADVYIDDLVVNANLDTEREIGWLLDEIDNILPSTSSTFLYPLPPSPTKKKNQHSVAARDFNTVQFVGQKVLKSSKSDEILGELFFYSQLPAALTSIFPSIFAVDYILETKTYTIETEFRQGLTYSHMLVGRSLTRGRLLTLLAGLHRIHTTDPLAENRGDEEIQLKVSPALAEKFKEHNIEMTGSPNLYANYGTKLRSRYFANKERYDSLGLSAANNFERLNEFLDTYEAEDKGVPTAIIHGDPVFSNVILSPDEAQQASSMLVLQSLMGYDHILLTPLDALPREKDSLLEEADERILENLRGLVWEWVEDKYGLGVHRKTLLRITASLMFSLIPLHNEELGPVFLRLCGKILALVSGSGAGYQGLGMGSIGVGGRRISKRISGEIKRSVSDNGKYQVEASRMVIQEKIGSEAGLKAVGGNRIKVSNPDIGKDKGKEVETEVEVEASSPSVVASDMIFSTVI